MLKKIFFVLSLAVILLSLAVSASGGILSPGMNIIQKDVRVIKTCSYGEKICFTKSDFTDILGEDELRSITISSLPDAKYGRLKFGNLDAFANQVISAGGIEFLTFEPAVSNVSCTFDFTVNEGDVKCLLYVIDKENSTPVGESFKVNTAEDIPVFSRLKGSDIDGDELEYIIVSQPENGRLTMTDKELGIFKYTPTSNFRGTDSFTYRICDKYGNLSDIATVTVKTSKNKSNMIYSDMAENPAQYASLVLAENNILVGEKIGDKLYFSPTEAVKRGDFLVMAMKCAGYSPNIFTQRNTGFSDDENIPSYTKGYVITAMNLGIDCSENGENVFSANEPINEYDASKIISSIISPDDVGEVLSFLDNTVIQTGNFGKEERMLTRQNAALLLNMIYENK